VGVVQHRDRTLRFAVIGPLAVTGPDGDLVSLAPGKRRDLLAALLRRRNSWVEIDVLAETLWGGAGQPRSISGSVKTSVHQLRKTLPPSENGQRLAGRGGAYRLTVEPGEIDLDVFESLIADGVDALAAGQPEEAVQRQRAALALWRGEPEDDAVDLVQRRHLEELRWTSRYCLADALVATGEFSEAIGMLRGTLHEDPLREPAWERLIAAQRAAGWQVDALASYEQARTILRDKFGAVPGAQLQGIYQTLLAETCEHEDPPPLLPRPAPQAAPLADSPSVPEGASVSRTTPVSQAARVTSSPPGPPSPRRPRRGLTAVLVLAISVMLLLNRSSADPQDATSKAALASVVAPKGAPAAAGARPKIVFGLGADAIEAIKSPLTASGIGMITTWYHGEQKQLEQFEGWRSDVIPEIYRSGKAVHLVVATWDKGTSLNTRFGRACGQPYPLSAEFVTDMRRLAAAFANRGDGPPLYISMFHGLQKLTCANSGYLADRATTNYYLALKERYFTVLDVIHEQAPNARVALNWDGWTASDDDPQTGSGRSMFQYFVEAMRASDFQSFNAFESDGNAEEIRRMVKILGAHGPVMVSYYTPHEDPVDVYEDDLRRTFTPSTLAQLVTEGLFAFSIRDDDVARSSPEAMTLTTQIVRDYGRMPPAAAK
jgi:DNA-binding SARP family transcriptional activator